MINIFVHKVFYNLSGYDLYVIRDQPCHPILIHKVHKKLLHKYVYHLSKICYQRVVVAMLYLDLADTTIKSNAVITSTLIL